MSPLIQKQPCEQAQRQHGYAQACFFLQIRMQNMLKIAQTYFQYDNDRNRRRT